MVSFRSTDNGLFFRRATTVNAGGTPTVSLLLSTIVGALFLGISFLGGNAFQRITAMLSFFFVANYTLSYTSVFVLSVFVLRKREPQMGYSHYQILYLTCPCCGRRLASIFPFESFRKSSPMFSG